MSPGAAAPWEWVVVGFMTMACVLYWCAHFHKFTVPSPDTYSYVQTSRELWDGELPSSFKRMPLFPALIGLVAKLIPGAEPEIEAALVINIVFGAGTLLLVYAVARRVTSWAALVPIALMGLSTETHLVVGQPLLDPMVGFMVVLCLWLFFRRSRWLHVTLFLLALTRYECAAMIGVLFLGECLIQRRIRRPLVLAIAAGSGWAAWMVLSVRSGHSTAGNAYLDEMRSLGWTINASFIQRVIEVSFQRFDLVLWSCLAALGLVASRHRDRETSAAILGFFSLYVLAHIVFSVVVSRYVYPVAWVLPLYAALGMESTVDWIRTRVRANWRSWYGPALTSAAAILGVLGLLFCVVHVRSRSGVASRIVYLGLALAFLVSVFGFAQLLRGKSRWPSLAVGFALVALLGRQAGIGTERHAKASWQQLYKHYDSYLVGKWLQQHLVDGEKALVPYEGMTRRFANISSKMLVGFQKLTSTSIDQLPAELADRGVVYVVYQYYKLPVDSRRAQLQLARYRPDLLDYFERGESVPGFEHVATLPIPKKAHRADVQIYRLGPLAE